MERYDPNWPNTIMSKTLGTTLRGDTVCCFQTLAISTRRVGNVVVAREQLMMSARDSNIFVRQSLMTRTFTLSAWARGLFW